MNDKIEENGSFISIKVNESEDVSRSMEVFYNPVMKFNRDTSILFLKAREKNREENTTTVKKSNGLDIALPLSGSGIRGIRFLNELGLKQINRIAFNDIKTKKNILTNLKLNKFDKKHIKNYDNKIVVKDLEANEFLLSEKGFNYIDVDPFGSPNPFLDNSIKRLSRDGILAVTATDTAPLCGTYVNACKRKYWATPLRNHEMHEIGLRILIRKVQLIGAQYDRALTPVLSYSKDHYFRVLFENSKGKEKVDKIIKEHGMYKTAGPLWLGKINNNKIIKTMISFCGDKGDDLKTKKFLEMIYDETKGVLGNTVGFFSIDKLAKQYKIKSTPKQDDIIKSILNENKKNKASKTHFALSSIRTNISELEVVKILKKLQ